MRELMYERGLRTRTGKKVLKSHIQRILKCVFYTGIMERDGKYYQGNHEPLISKQLFDDARRVMSVLRVHVPIDYFSRFGDF